MRPRGDRRALSALVFAVLSIFFVDPVLMFFLPTPAADVLAVCVGLAAVVYAFAVALDAFRDRGGLAKATATSAILIAVLVTAYNFLFIFSSIIS